MKNTAKYGLCMAILCAGASGFIYGDAIEDQVNLLPYRFAGSMYISSAQKGLSYQLYALDDTSSKWLPQGKDFPVNQAFTVKDLFGGKIAKTPKMSWNGQKRHGTEFMLVPQFKDKNMGNKELLSKAAFALVSRKKNILNIYLVGPTKDLQRPSIQKIEFDLDHFNRGWVKKSAWYGRHDHHAGIAFAFSFNADAGTFVDSSATGTQITDKKKDFKQSLSDDAIYLVGVAADKGGPLDWSWTSPKNQSIEKLVHDTEVDDSRDSSNPLTMKKLEYSKIVTHKGPYLDQKEMKEVIDTINKIVGITF